jgi:hypothetical protein
MVGYIANAGNRGTTMQSESIESGDRVRTSSGETGRVVHTARLSVFVQLDSEPSEATIKAFLLSDLTKIEPPETKNGDLGANS